MNTLTIEKKDYRNVVCDYCKNDNEETYYLFTVEAYDIYRELYICELDKEEAIDYIKINHGVKVIGG
jgi:ssDNA-specific exonuclease RecJ